MIGRDELAMRVLMMTQRLDDASPVLAFTVDWVAALAARVDRVDVVCLAASPDRTRPANVHVWPIGARGDATAAARLLAFERRIAELAGDADVLFAHMVPRYAWLAAPLARARGKPVVLWYVHRQTSGELRMALAASAFVATAVPGSFPLPSAKVRVLGHGVNAAFFSPGDGEAAAPPVVAMVGRLAPIKRQATLVEAVARLRDRGSDVRAVFAGAPAGEAGSAYAAELRALVSACQLDDRVTFAGSLSPPGVRALYRRATTAVNLSPDGLFDKAPLESMMTGTATIVGSAAFDPVLGAHATRLRVADPADPAAVAASLERLLALPAAERARIARDVRERATAEHGLDGLMDRLVALMRTAADR